MGGHFYTSALLTETQQPCSQVGLKDDGGSRFNIRIGRGNREAAQPSESHEGWKAETYTVALVTEPEKPCNRANFNYVGQPRFHV